MRATLLVKFTICYLIIMSSSLFILNTLGTHLMERMLTEDKLELLEQEASVISSDYMETYYRSNMTLSNLSSQLRTIDTFVDARIWIVSKERYIITDTRSNSIQRVRLSEDFISRDFWEDVTIDGLVDEPALCVIHPVNVNFDLKGYIVLLSPVGSIQEAASNYIDILTTCFLLIAVVFLAVMIYLYAISILPLRRNIRAAREYARGNLNYKQKKHRSHDEFQDLSDTIEYMASELNQMEATQHKFIANISHDFRSPLTSIRGYTEAMIDGTIPPELHEKYLGIIRSEVDRLTKLTSGILELNSFDNNSIRLDITTFDINQVIKQTAASFEGTCRTKRITLNLTFSDHEALVHADMSKIQQVLYNLIDNAIKFSHHDSRIDVSTYERGTKIFVSVKDYGVGIPKDSIKKIWDRFYKLDTSRGKDKKGTGLGLSIVKEAINMHGENINVISTEGVGTEFIFTLPLAAQD